MDASKSVRVAAATLVSLIVLLPACGGGGGGGDAPANTAPVANAGAAQRVLVPGTAVALDGRGSSDANGQALTYRWTLTSRPAFSTASFGATASQAQPGFTADRVGTYVATLVVNDGVADSAPATVTITGFPVFAFANAFSPTTTSYSPPDAYNSVSDNNTGVVVTRIEAGSYRVRLANLAALGAGMRFLTLANAVASFNGERCVANRPVLTGNDLDAFVLCSVPDGSLVDSQFNLLVLGERSVRGPYGFSFVRTTNPVGVATLARNASTEGVMSAQFTATGRTTVDFGVPILPGDQFLTFVAANASSSLSCRSLGRTNSSLQVSCTDGANNAANADFDTLLITEGRPGRAYGMAYANDPTSASYTLIAALSQNTGGGPITATRSGVGQYRMVFGGLNNRVTPQRRAVIVSPEGAAAYCSLIGFGGGASQTGLDMDIDIRCYSAAGALIDSRYTVMVLE